MLVAALALGGAVCGLVAGGLVGERSCSPTMIGITHAMRVELAAQTGCVVGLLVGACVGVWLS